MKKDQEEERIKYMLEQPETVSDKYFSVKEYIELSGYPLIKFDFFLLELMNITASVLSKYKKTNNDVSKEIVKKLYGHSKGFYNACINCEYNCLKTPLKNMSFKSLLEKGLQPDSLPEELQKQTCMNFFYIEFLNVLVSGFFDELCNVIDKETADEMTSALYWALIDYVSDNCSGECNNECIKEHDKSAYCKFCSFGSKKLPCPKEGEISYEAIKATEGDMEH